VGHMITFSRVIGAPPDAVFNRVVDVDALPTWNGAIREVVERPDSLAPGAVWKVKIHALGSTWVSRSEVTALDRADRRFAYRSQSDDGNPSYADWNWKVDSETGGSQITVTVDANPKSFFRKYLLIHVRKPSLRKEMQVSLAKLSELVQKEAPAD
jgi:uncharacterized protein YndB with AHSA1/START domain